MTSKKWCFMFLISLGTVVIILMLLNFLVDPFGVFGDKIYNWYSYAFTNNPRVGKISYLDKHYEEYDSYIVGCSSTSSFPTEDLNKYFDANFYNMIMYGADMLDVEETCKYILENYNTKNIVVNVYLSNGTLYNEEYDNITRNLHANVNGESKLSFYNRYLFLDPHYSFAKISDARKDTYLTQPFDVFNIETGAYDKKVRDVEPIGSMEKYLEAYPVFVDYPKLNSVMTEIDSTVKSIQRIKEMCESKGVNFVLVSAPVYYDYFNYYTKEDITNFYTKIAEVTPFWDFTISSISKEPRYFYDETHFRNAVGKMAIARMFEDESVYYPDDFGVYVTSENVASHIESFWNVENDETSYTKNVPILMYHHIVEGADTDVSITPELFEEHIKTLVENGYTGVFFDELIEYVEEGISLPEKPICITFDDGYLSNYEIAFKILKKYNMKATIFIVGSSVGKTYYKDTNYEIIPHFNYDEAKEMEDSGLIKIESHSYDMHQAPAYEVGDKIRENMIQLPNESEAEFIEALSKDFEKINKEIKENLGKEITVVAYPHGDYNTLTNVVLKEHGVKVTLSTNAYNNTIIKGLPQSLYGLNRYNISQNDTVETILEYVEK